MGFESIYIPRINANRLTPYGATWEIDYNNRFPRLDLMKHREQYQQGEKSNKKYYCNWLSGKTLSWQFEIAAPPIPNPQPGITVRLYNFETGTYTTLSVSDNTPVGWTAGWKRKKISHTPTTAGLYYIWIYVDFYSPSVQDIYMTGDVFKVHTTLSSDKDLFEVKYKNSYNKFGYIFDGYYYGYFEGRTDRGKTEINNTIIDEDDGSYVTQSKRRGVKKLITGPLHRTQVDILEMMLCCNDSYLNGEPITCKDGIEPESIERSDLINVTANLPLRNSDDFMNYL